MGKELVKRGGVPMEPEELLQLPGVGRYAAHSVPVFAGDRNLPVVDWVIGRAPVSVLRSTVRKADELRREALWARELWLGTLDFATAVCKTRPLPRVPVAG